MARLKLPEGSIAAVETIRKRLDRTMEQFSEDLGFGKSAYSQAVRDKRITQTVALAAEALMRRQAPSAADELIWLTRIVRGIPQITMLDGNLREMTLDGQQYLLLPKDERGPKPAPIAHAGNGAIRPAAAQPALDYAEAAQG